MSELFASYKQYHNPTINFAKLSKMCDDFVKQYLNNI